MQKAKTEIKAPDDWLEMNKESRKMYMANVLRMMAFELENEQRTITMLEKLNVNGNTRAIEIRFACPSPS